ncbi:MAG: efflux RND transporter permease subunit [Clostridia bacterium]|nr:MAG: efflux RND transporter permease subunit [Clostridia bacterium]
MAILVVVLLGVVSLSGLSLELFPALEMPIAAVITTYQGAGPEEIENLVTRPLEETLSTVSGVDSVQSTSQAGTSMVMLQFAWGTDMDFATLDMREKVDLIKGFLPTDAQDPMVLKLDPTMMPVMQLSVSGDMDLAQLKAIAEDTIKNRLERIDGVASVNVMGGLTREVQVIVDPARLASYGLSLAQVTQALAGENLNLSGGQVRSGKQEYLIRVTGQFDALKQVGQVPIPTPAGTVVRVQDVAEVRDAYADKTSISRLDGRDSISLSVNRQTNANSVDISRQVHQALEELRQSLPGNLQIYTVYDEADYIQSSLNNVIQNLVIGAILAALVLLIFLRSFRSTVIVGLSMPVSVIATFVLMRFGHLDLNMMTLGGLALGIGMMVSGGIIVLENIYRLREEGFEPEDAAVQGTVEVTNAVVASILTNVVVFLPIVFTQGLANELFTPLALTVTFSLLASLIVSLTQVPMMAARFLGNVTRPAQEKVRSGRWGGFMATTETWLTRLDNFYSRMLKWSLGHRWLVVGVCLILVVASAALVPVLGMELIPAMDQGRVTVNIQLPHGTALEETEKVAGRVEALAGDRNRFPEVEAVATTMGSSDFGQMGFGFGAGISEIATVELDLVPLGERHRSSREVAEAMRTAVRDIPGAEITVNDNALTGMAGGLMAPVEVDITGDDLQLLGQLAEQAAGIVREVPGTREVKSSLEEGRPEVEVRIDRGVAGQYGLSVAQIASVVRTAIQGQVATQYRTGGDEIDVRVRFPEEARRNLQDLEDLLLLSPTGTRVPLRAVAEVAVVQGPNTIQRSDQVRQVAVTANLGAGYNLGQVMGEIQRRLGNLPLPAGYAISYGGETEQINEAFGSLYIALLIAIFLVYMIMAAQFESLVHPFTVMFSLPVAAIGAILGLLITGRSLSITAFIGAVVLVGVAVNNAIVLVDYFNLLRGRGMPRDEAILEGGPRRLRAILMTTLTTVLGMFPLALGIGEGAEAQAPMATVVVGGMLTSTILGLLLVPVLYTIFDDLSQRINRRRQDRGVLSQEGGSQSV